MPSHLQQVNLFAFARNEQQIRGELSLADLPRMLNEVAPHSPAHPPFCWTATGERRIINQDKIDLYLHFTLNGMVWLECQRCLAPYQQQLCADIYYRIVNTDAEANAAPMNEAADVIVGSHQFDLVDLFEEELLLALPWVPKHSVCPAVHQTLVAKLAGKGVSLSNLANPIQPEGPCKESPSPFVALAALRSCLQDK